MTHVRQQIRDAAATQLTGLTLTGTNVFKCRAYNLPDTKLPCLLVYTNNEAIVYATKGRGGDVAARSQFRELQLVVQIYAEGVTGTSDPYDVVDDVIVDVEEALAGQSLGGLIKTLELFTINCEQDGKNKEVATAVLVFNVRYDTLSNAVEAAI